MLQSQGAETLLGRPERESEVALEVLLADSAADKRLFVRVLPFGPGQAGGYVSIFTKRRQLDAIQDDLPLATRIRQTLVTQSGPPSWPLATSSNKRCSTCS
ncbi:MAG: hypothetical protein ACT4PU_10240 [Planctomycetota bacterium]